jgi:Rrf2 family protein
MFLYGKMAANGIAVMSCLAAQPEQKLGAREIAERRRISRALTAKLLTQLSSAGLVTGQPGPGGGYTLARAPSAISLFQIVALFEQTADRSVCPFGRDWCGNREPCPLHASIVKLREDNLRFLNETTLEVFLVSPAPRRKRSRASA